MLILTRHLKQSLIIDDDIEICFLGYRSDGQIILGINAPKNVSVDRKEIYESKLLDKIKKELEE